MDYKLLEDRDIERDTDKEIDRNDRQIYLYLYLFNLVLDYT